MSSNCLWFYAHLQRHDIIKKRIDSHGNVIETRQDGIGAPKIERPLQKHGGRLEHNETYCGSCYGAETESEARLVHCNYNLEHCCEFDPCNAMKQSNFTPI
nr:endoplasmic reticulum-Golgi intermediate compartment protein 3-like [Ipomoea batatas]GMD85084.1 endoplasmic reticulum-Golgi intermediate compartment protein 3-like [Ipomoea batatas]GMD88786.1 endoplasmic reticulum-Golgi intermediate compartment protein 3-like [Ipomoea batatas]GMD91222.1 endoplasmic reticulum-Golgi intermediate compartment protein 3-like [Ipomoea batatas]GMD94054.1 endoplasmic reticulum-Golgi intermediate compartment protein 3-like [Ipomoea batatas]